MAKMRANTVQVTGHGVFRTIPDVAFVSVGVDILHPVLADAQSEATRSMQAVLDAIKAADIPEADIQTAGYGIYVLRNWNKEGDPTNIQGYRVWNRATVKVRQLGRLGSVLDTVVSQGANSISAVNFAIDDPTAAESQARALAVEDARRKANELASAAGLSIGRVLSIREGSEDQHFRHEVRYSLAESAASVPIEAGTQEVTVDLQVSFELR